MSLAQKFSGIVINQNQPPEGFLTSGSALSYQEFFLPENYTRGNDYGERITPPLTGIQILVGVEEGRWSTACLSYQLEHYDGFGWKRLVEGSATGAHTEGQKLWFDAYFTDPVPVDGLSDHRFRIGFSFPTFKGVNKVWYAQPNPLAQTNSSRLYASDGVTAIQPNGMDASICFRVLGLVGDEGFDYLGNPYRSAVRASAPHNVSTTNAEDDAIWLSKPNPSRFAVESLYFDVRPMSNATYSDEGDPIDPQIKDAARVVDRVTVDPITPGVWFNIYYSNEGDKPTTEEEWENKLWTRAAGTYKANKRESHALEEPILAKFIKVEFSHLQAKSYDPGDFAQPVRYKKHPKWVLDYFFARLDEHRREENRLIDARVAVVFDALDLAYNYYLDDLKQEPNQPVEIDAAFKTSVESFISRRDDLSDQIDPALLPRINLAMLPYSSHPSGFGDSTTLLGQSAQSNTSVNFGEYPVERAILPSSATPDVAALRNTEVAFENEWPVMFFYLTCRHKYREVIAPFSHNRAYFVGIREIAFTREQYSVAHDNNTYIEPAGDMSNIERNDFESVDGTMRVPS